MKKKFILIAMVITAMFSVIVALPACDVDPNGDIKSITKPYVTEYECTEARLGEENLLEKFKYIKLSLLDDKQMELSYKLKNGDGKSYKCDYEFNEETRELTADFWMFGIARSEKITVENGGFTITRTLFSKPLYMKFETK